MHRLLLVSAILSFLSLGVRSQSQCGNTMACTTDCAASTGSCCVLQPQTPSTNNPLGYTAYTLPGTDDDLPFPCVRILYPESAVGRVNYLVVAAETQGTSLCIRQTGTVPATCGTSRVFFCMSVTVSTNSMYIDVDLLCEGVGPSCEAAEFNFFIRAEMSTVDNDVENFCDTNGTLLLPSDLAVPPDSTNRESTPFTPPSAGAAPLQVLSFLTLTLISALTTWVWSH